MTSSSRNALAAGALFVAFLAVYSSLGSQFAGTTAFRQLEVLFGIDSPRVIQDMTVPGANHYRTTVHPLFVLFTNPLGAPLARGLNNTALAAVHVNAFFGAIGVALVFLLFRLAQARVGVSLSLAALFGVSMAQMFSSAIPTTDALAINALALTYLNFLYALRHRRLVWWAWILTGILGLGVTTTILVQTALCFLVAAWQIQEGRRLVKVLRQTTIYCVIVLVLTALLALVQQALYPTCKLWFLPGIVSEESMWFGVMLLERPLFAVMHNLRHFLLINVVAADPCIASLPNTVGPVLTYTCGLKLSLLGWLCAVPWIALSAVNLVRPVQRTVYPPGFALGVSGCVLFSVVLNNVYGTNWLFLYAVYYTLPVFLLLTRPLLSWSRSGWLLVPFLGLLAAHNVSVIRWIIAQY